MSQVISRDSAYDTAVYHLTYGDPAMVLGRGWWRKHGCIYGPSVIELHDIYHDPKAVVTGGDGWVLTKQAVRTMDDVMTAVELLIRYVRRVNHDNGEPKDGSKLFVDPHPANSISYWRTS